MSSDEVVKKLKAQLRDLRKKYKEVRQENKEIWEKAEKHDCCKHVHKRGQCLEIRWPHDVYCQYCNSMKPMFFGEIMDDEMTKRHVWLCHDCHDGEEPTSWGLHTKFYAKNVLRNVSAKLTAKQDVRNSQKSANTRVA